MRGIYFDWSSRSVHRLNGDELRPGLTLITHDVHASLHHCRRILREWLGPEELRAVDWSGFGAEDGRCIA